MAQIVTLTWVDPTPTTNVDHIEIWRSVSGGALAQLGADLALGVQTLVDDNGGSGYADGIVIDYEGRIYNNLGGEVEGTDYIVTDLQVTIVDAPSVTPPTLLADAGGETNPDTEINLTWTKSVDGVMTNYRVYIGGVLQQTFGDVALGTLTGLTAETAYNNITVRAWNGTTESADSNSINVTTEAAASAYPTNHYTSDFSAGVDLWTALQGTITSNEDAVSDGTTSYDDCLKVYANTVVGQHGFSGNKLLAGTEIRLRFDYYIPSGQTSVDGFKITDTDGDVLLRRGNDPQPAVVGTWTSDEVIWTASASASNNMRIIFSRGTSGINFAGANDINDDRMYIRNVVIDY